MSVVCGDESCPECVAETARLSPIWDGDDLLMVVYCDECCERRERADRAGARLGHYRRP